MGVVIMQTLSEHVALTGVELDQLPTTPGRGTMWERKGTRYGTIGGGMLRGSYLRTQVQLLRIQIYPCRYVPNTLGHLKGERLEREDDEREG